MHSFSVDDHPKTLSPSRHLKRYLEVTHPASQRMPALALTDQRQETQPLEKRHLDRIVCVPALQKLQDFPLEKRPVHAKLQGMLLPSRTLRSSIRSRRKLTAPLES